MPKKKPKILQDPFAEREAQKYARPVPSREFILQYLAEQGKPLTQEQLINACQIGDDEELVEGIARRLKAMQRDGQLMRNRRGAYALVEKMHLIAGTVLAHKDGFGFLRPDKGGDDLFIGPRQMRQVFHGDRVLVAHSDTSWRGKPEVNIIEVIERRYTHIVGRFHIENDVGFVQPSNRLINQDIFISPRTTHKATPGQIVNVHILNYPTLHRQALGEIEEILGQEMAPGMEIDVALRSYDIPYEWPLPVLNEIKECAGTVPPQEIVGRQDLRSLPLVTIDGDDAKDFDDAVYCIAQQNGWKLYVAIADVSHYVKPGTALDTEAKKRGNSVYFPGRVIPMLPEALSNGLCSLNPKVDRLCLVCEIDMNAEGKVIKYDFYSAVIRSQARLTYTNVQKIFDGDLKLRRQYSSLLSPLTDLLHLFQILLKSRKKRGALEFETIETKIIFSAQKKISKIVPAVRLDAHRVIEECMLVANVCAADFVLQKKMPALFRIHAGPTDTKLQELRQFLAEFALELGGGKQPTPADYAALIAKIQMREDHYLIQTVLLRSLAQAVYSPDNIGHFGLAYKAYAHFTSPIRRYPDLLLHRAIRALIEEKSSVTLPTHASMLELGDHCSQTERRADEATRDVTSWLKCEFMQEKLGKIFTGRISGVTHFGVFVTLDEVYVEGLVHVTSLPEDYYDFDPVRHALCGQRTKHHYRLGNALKVRVSHVDLDKRQIDFVLVNSSSV